MSLTRVCVCLANAKQNCAQECANPNIAEIPPAFSLISVDTYAGFTPGSSGLDEVKQAKAMYDIIFPKLHPHQQVMLVPGTFACSNLSYFPLDDQAKNNVEKLEGYFSWAKQEKRIAGFNPWVSAAAPFASSFSQRSCCAQHYNTRAGAQSGPPCDMRLGASSMPTVVSKLKEIGHYIIAQSALGV